MRVQGTVHNDTLSEVVELGPTSSDLKGCVLFLTVQPPFQLTSPERHPALKRVENHFNWFLLKHNT